MKDYNKIIASMSIEELVGQLLCYDVYDKDDEKEVNAILRKIKPGGLFIGTPLQQEKLKRYTDVINECTKVPVIVASDIIDGPGNVIAGEYTFSTQLGRTAMNDLKLHEEAGRLTAKRCREYGYHWTFGPCVDIAYNKQSPISNVGVMSDDPDVVIKNARAFNKGLMENAYLMPTLKHFPGDGTDDRNPHFCTTINRLSREEWYKTYGRVYKTLIDEGAPSVMIGHVALPWIEDCENPNECLPATLSYNVMTKLLKEELGFEGCIVSDAMSMIGAASVVPLKRLAIEFFKAGGDMLLFPEPTDYDLLIEAVKSGEITEERLHDAVRRNLILKDKARLFEEQDKVLAEINVTEKEIEETANIIANKSIKFVRNSQGILPLQLPEKAKILMANIVAPFWNQEPTGQEFAVMREELEKRGYNVVYKDNIKHKEVKEIMDNFDVIFVNSIIHPGNYHGATLRLGWNNIMTFWRGYILQHPKLVFVSFGDPNKLYEFPYLKTYVNAYSNSPETQQAAVRVLLGEEPMTAQNPTELKGFFKREINGEDSE